ncbi:hypothetical protein Tco_1051572 [Tanacetum coccineum]
MCKSVKLCAKVRFSERFVPLVLHVQYRWIPVAVQVVIIFQNAISSSEASRSRRRHLRVAGLTNGWERQWVKSNWKKDENMAGLGNRDMPWSTLLPACEQGADDSALLSRLLFDKIPGVPSSYYSRGHKRQDGECVKNICLENPYTLQRLEMLTEIEIGTRLETRLWNREKFLWNLQAYLPLQRALGFG